MFVSVGCRTPANADLHRIEQATPPDQRWIVRFCARVLRDWIKFDPHEQGDQPTARDIRRIIHGPLMVFFWVRPADDRYAEILGWSRNLDWQP